MRRLFALAVVILHVLLLVLLMSGVRPGMDLEPALPVFVNLWITPVEPDLPEPRIETPPAPASPSASRSAVPVEAPPAAEAPPAQSAAIPTPVPAISIPTPGSVDWANESKLAARRAAERLGTEQQKDFSPPPKALAKPCVPRKSSMEWNGEEDRPVTWVGPIPIVKVGKRCVVTLGFFACTLGELPEVNGHLLDDMRAPDRQTSSVPDIRICD